MYRLLPVAITCLILIACQPSANKMCKDSLDRIEQYEQCSKDVNNCLIDQTKWVDWNRAEQEKQRFCTTEQVQLHMINKKVTKPL